MTDKRTLRIRQNPAMSNLPPSGWPRTGRPPHALSEHWMRRFLSLNHLQPAIEKMMFEFAPPSDADLSEAFAELYRDKVVVSESTPDLLRMQSEFIVSMYRDVGLVSRLFVTEAGLKCLIALSGSTPGNWHKLNQLYDLLPPAVQTELGRAYAIVVKNSDAPDSVALIPSVTGVVELYNDLYQELRYPEPETDERSIISAWNNLGNLIDAILIIAMSHESHSTMTNVSEASIE